jgi:hypothetical protein
MKNFIITFFISSASILSLCIGLITAIDPYNKLGNNFFGFETKAVAQSRENKFHMFESSKKDYTAFILGSSAAHRYSTEKINKLTGLTAFNYAVQHSTPIDYLAIIKHILSKSTPKLILLQLDFAGLDETYKVDNRLFNSPLNKFLKDQKPSKMLFHNNNFTLDALRDSFRVVFVNKFGTARHIYLEDGNYLNEKPKRKAIKIRQGNSIAYRFSIDRVRILKEISNLCKINDIELIAFSAPLSIDHVQKIQSLAHLRNMHIKFKKEMTKVFGSFWDFQNSTISKYNDYNYFLDSTHPSKEMSSLVLDILLGKKENHLLGKKLTL